jgi:membrane fusion protein, heavy metal efflux system
MIIRLGVAILLISMLPGCTGSSPDEDAHGHAQTEAEYERGPHRGRMLREGPFALEVTIFETNVPPHYRLYAYADGAPVDPAEVEATIELKRLDGETNRFTFKPEGDYLVGSGEVVEPHSFDVHVNASSAGTQHHWTFPSYEGRTAIPSAVADEAGIRVETAGPAMIRDSVHLMGNVALNANRHSSVTARFPGTVRAVQVQQGDRVKRGQTLVLVEGNESMRTFPVSAPFDGVVLARSTSVGDVAGSDPLIEIADLSRLWVELHAIGTAAEQLQPGQAMRVKSATGELTAMSEVDSLLPLATRAQSVVARGILDNPEGRWRPGMAVSGDVTVSQRNVPLAVKVAALQRFRDFTVVFAQVGETYEVRMLDLGASDGEFVEVLGGLKPGTSYVTDQSFLIKADIEKSGASHDH